MKCIGYELRNGTFTTEDGKVINYSNVRFYCIEPIESDNGYGHYHSRQMQFDIKSSLLDVEPRNYVGLVIEPKFRKGSEKAYGITVFE